MGTLLSGMQDLIIQCCLILYRKHGHGILKNAATTLQSIRIKHSVTQIIAN